VVRAKVKIFLTQCFLSPPLSADERLSVSQILQKVKIEVTEEGTMGAAASGKHSTRGVRKSLFSDVIQAMSPFHRCTHAWHVYEPVLCVFLAAVMFSRMAPMEIAMDTPFLFLIQHKATGEKPHWLSAIAS